MKAEENTMKLPFQLSHVTAGFTAIVVGYTSSIIIVIQAATASNANTDQIASWLLVLGLAMGITSIIYSWWLKIPILTAWSTSGAAMLVTAVSGYPLSEITGAFIINGVLITITGLIKPLNRMLSNISPQIATAMLAAILLPICLKAFAPISYDLVTFSIMFVCFLLAKRFTPTYAMLILLIVSLVISLSKGTFEHSNFTLEMSDPVWVSPHFDLSAIINIAIPLYVITMLSQNLPGIAMLQSHHYKPDTKPIFIGTGVTTTLLAPFGCFSVNLAAISAAICMNDQVDKEPSKRYKAVVWAGLFYLLAGIWGATIVELFMHLPKSISQILAGLALFSTLIMCLNTMMSDSNHRESAGLTFLIALSGVTILGLNAPILGLLAGLCYAKLFNR